MFDKKNEPKQTSGLFYFVKNYLTERLTWKNIGNDLYFMKSCWPFSVFVCLFVSFFAPRLLSSPV